MTGDSLGELIELRGKLEERKKSLNAELKLIESKITKVDADIMSVMDAGGIKLSASATGKVAVDTHIYPKLETWSSLEEHIFETRSLVLLTRRIALLPYREMLTLGRPVPGVVPSHVRKLTYRPLNDDDEHSTDSSAEQSSG
jgi:hypothetical protein